MRDAILNRLATIVWRVPLAIVALALAVAGLSIAYASATLRLNANTDDLIARDRPFMRGYREFLAEFGDLEFLIVALESDGDTERTEAAVDALTMKLRAIAELPGVFSAIMPQEQLRIATRAMPEQELADLARASGAFPAFMSGGGPKRVLHDATAMLNRLIVEGAQLEATQQERLGASAIFLLNTIAAANQSSASRRELSSLLERQPEYFTSHSKRFYFITIMPVKDYSTLSVIEEPLRRIRAAIEEVRREFPGISIGLTGKPVLQADEMATSNQDMTKASVLAFTLCAILFVVMIGGVVRPLLALLAFAIGSAWTYGAAALLVGQLNLLSIVFMLVLIGVALDYGVHVISRYREARRGLGVRESIRSAMLTATRGNLSGALASSTVFFMAFFTTFQGLRELGLIAGAGLLLCLIAITLVLPSLLALIDGRRARADAALNGSGAAAVRDASGRDVLSWLVARSATILIAVAVLSLGLIAAPGSLRFEHNLLELQARGLESVQWEHRIMEDSASETWFGAVIADSQEHALDVIERARERPSIGAIRSVFEVIAPPTVQRDELRRRLHEPPAAATQPATSPAKEPSDWVLDDLRRAIEALNVIATGAARQAPQEAEQLRRLSVELNALARQVEREAAAESSPARQRLDQVVAEISGSLQMMLAGDRLELRQALPDVIARQYISPQGRYLVALHPKENVWEYAPMKRFIDDMRAVDPHVTGVPITHFESLGEMLRAFLIMSILALVVIVVIVWLDFRRIRDVVLAIVPLLLSLAWTVEIMGLLGISFNLANFFCVPILIGLGVDASVHVLHRYHEGGPTRFSLGATRRAVILTALTTIIGFGCLMIAQHRGLRSLGMAMAIGSTCGMLASVVVLPALLAWLERRSTWRSAAADAD